MQYWSFWIVDNFRALFSNFHTIEFDFRTISSECTYVEKKVNVDPRFCSHISEIVFSYFKRIPSITKVCTCRYFLGQGDGIKKYEKLHSWLWNLAYRCTINLVNIMENSIAQVPEKFKVVEILGVILQSTAVLQELILIVEALSKKSCSRMFKAVSEMIHKNAPTVYCSGQAMFENGDVDREAVVLINE